MLGCSDAAPRSEQAQLIKVELGLRPYSRIFEASLPVVYAVAEFACLNGLLADYS